MTTSEKINSAFNGYIGQEQSVENARTDVLAYTQSGVLPKVLLTGIYGLGKSEFISRYAKAWESVGVQVVTVTPSAYKDRSSTIHNDIKRMFISGEKWILIVDEAHAVSMNKGLEGAKDIGQAIHLWTDETCQTKIQTWRSGEETYIPCNTRGGIVLATNEFEKIDKPMRDRLSRYDLVLYTKDELQLILSSVVRRFGLKWSSDKLSAMVATCGRGRARPMIELIKRILIIRAAEKAIGNDGTTVITREIANRALKAEGMLPFGVTQDESRLIVQLEKMQASKAGRLQARLIMENDPFKQAFKGADGLAFIQPVGHEWCLSPEGHAWVALCRKDGFALPIAR